MMNIEAELISWIASNIRYEWPSCIMHVSDGSEDEGSLCCFDNGSDTVYFLMPEVSQGDILWWSSDDESLYLTRCGMSPRTSRQNVETDSFSARFIGNAVDFSEMVARFEGDVLEALCGAFSFSAEDELEIGDAEHIEFGSFYEQIPVFADVPKQRPPAFVSVESTGGRGGFFHGTQMVSIQSWAPTRFEASSLAISARDAVYGIADDRMSDVSRVDAGMPYNFPTGDCPRYQFVADVSAV